MKQIIFFLIIFYSSVSVAQTYQPDKIKAKAVTKYEQAINLLQDGVIKSAIPILQATILIDTNYMDAYLSLAAAYGQLKPYAAARDK